MTICPNCLVEHDATVQCPICGPLGRAREKAAEYRRDRVKVFKPARTGPAEYGRGLPYKDND